MECKYDQLSCAGSVDEVVRVTCDFLSTWSADELSRLPDRCRPDWVSSGADIEFWTDRLQGEAESVLLLLEDEDRLDRLTNHFLIASVRLRQLDRVTANASPPSLASMPYARETPQAVSSSAWRGPTSLRCTS